MQCERSSSSSGFVLFTLGMKRAPNTGTLVGCYGDPASREGHFSEDTEGRATLKYYQVTHVWFSNLIRAFEIPVGLWHRLCVHSQGWLRLGSFSFEIQEKRLQKLVNSALQPGRWWSNPKEQCFEWFGDQRTLCLLQAVQKQQRQGELCPQSIPHMTKNQMLLSSHSCAQMRKSLLHQLPWWELCHCCLLVFDGERHCFVGNVWGAGPCTFEVQVSEATATYIPFWKRGLGSWVQVSMTIRHQIIQKHFQKYFRCQIACWNC